MLHLLVLPLLVTVWGNFPLEPASLQADNWIACSDYTCPIGYTYTIDGAQQSVSDCKSGPNIFSKLKDDTKNPVADSMLKFCQAKGFDTVGKVWTFLVNPVNVWKHQNVDYLPAICVATSEVDIHNTGGGRNDIYPYTWECTNTSAAPCCTSWDASCYTTRQASNNWHSCDACGPPPGPCDTECGGWQGTTAGSEACKNCCQTVSHEQDWKCDEATKKCKEIKDRSECDAAGHCKSKTKKGVMRKCKPKKCRTIGDSSECEAAGCTWDTAAKKDCSKKKKNKN